MQNTWQSPVSLDLEIHSLGFNFSQVKEIAHTGVTTVYPRAEATVTI